jgi:tetratricopeptide (TPR) repeat protein
MALLTAIAISQTTPNAPSSTKSSSSAPQSPLSSAQELIKSGKFTEAAARFRQIVSRNDAAGTPEAYAGLVRSLLKLDDVAGAEEASVLGVRAYPQSSITQTARGDVRFRSGAIIEAEELYQSALKLDAKNARAWLGMGRVDSALSRQAKAKEDFARAHELDPSDGDALYYWSVRQPYPENVNSLEKHLAEFRDDQERERHEREYIAFLKALAGRKVWILAHDVDQSDIKLHPVITRLQDGPRAYALSVRLNDRATASVMLDTGASGLTISRKMAEKAGAIKLSEHSLEGVGSTGASAGYAGWLDKVTIGDFEFHDCHVHVSPNMNADYDGLIGTDVFEQYLVTIDFPAHKLSLSRTQVAPENSGISAEAADPLQFFRVGHILLMPTSVGDTAHGLFALDTGASTNAISPALARQVSTVRDSNVLVNGMSGRVQNVYSADQTTLQFGRFRQPHENIVTFDIHGLSKDLGLEVSGFIGFATLKKMKLVIDYQNGRVDFDYKP